MFTAANIRNCQEYVSGMQKRLDRAVANKDYKGIRDTFDILTKRSLAVKILAVWKITQNKGSRTAGVDGECIPKNATRKDKDIIRAILLMVIRLNKEPSRIRRAYIAKSNGKKRPLGIPTLRDRINQEILRIALEPIVEYHSHDNSFGFRPKRSCHDAIASIFLNLAKADRKRYIVEGDIKGCFDHISHDHISATLRRWKVPEYAITIIEKMLKAGVIYFDKVTETEAGTPQGGVISPMLANVAMTSFDDYIANHYGKREYHGGKHYISPMIRYADDFIILCESKQKAKQVKDDITRYLSKNIGLTLSEEKTTITHIREGFNFLGFTIRKFPVYKHNKKGKTKLIIKPQKEKINNLLRECKELLQKNKHADQDVLVMKLNQKITGWGMYYRHVVSSKIFDKIDYAIWHKAYKWSKKQQNNKNAKWILHKFFTYTNGLPSHFGKNVKITKLSRIPIIRFVKVKRGVRIHNQDDANYWKKREDMRAYNTIVRKSLKILFKKQKGVCPQCNTPISAEQVRDKDLHIHHVIPKAKGGKDSYSNLRLLHAECHRDIHRNIAR